MIRFTVCLLLLPVVFLLFFAGSAEATARFMTLNGATSGTCTTSGAACRFDYLVSLLACGDTVTVLNGNYTGANNMINTSTTFGGTTPANPTCTLGNEIAWSAETDGGVFFNGQFARAPFLLDGLTYWTFDGFDAGNADAAGANFAFAGASLNHVTVTRSCFSNTQKRDPGDNLHTFAYYGTGVQNSTFEDICVFGTGRNQFVEGTTPGAGNVYRRWWIRYEGWCPNSGGQVGGMPMQPSYYSSAGTLGSGGNNLWENFIVIYDPEQYDQSPTCSSWTDDGPIPGLFQRGASLPNTFKGMIFYGYDGFTVANRTATQLAWFIDAWAAVSIAGDGAYTRVYEDIFLDRRSQSDSTNGKAFSLLCTAGGGLCNNNTADRLTAIKHSANPASTVSGWSSTNFNECTSLSSCPNFYTGTSPGTGSRACFRYSNGTLTSTPLWPWPMDDRIKAALARANAAGTGGSALAGTAGVGYAASTVTSEIVSRYDTIPDACNTAASGTAPTAPSNLRLGN